jgi:OHCU decarboxylase
MRPFSAPDALFAAADQVWAGMHEEDWMQAFRAHPRIGERKAAHASAQSSAWSRQEQQSVETSEETVLRQLAQGNARYEELYGFTYIVCATGKSAKEMLAILDRRLGNSRETELREAAEQQRQITQIRLRKWLNS